MAIFDIFRSAPTQQQQPQPGPENQHIQNNPTVPTSQNSPDQKPTPENPNPESPVANFAELWKMEPTQQNQAPNFRIDPQQLSKVTSSMNFAKSVSRDDLAKVAQGGEEAVGAMVNILNQVGRDIFGMGAQFSSHMTEQGYNTAQTALNTGIPNLVKKQVIQNELFQANPKLKEPALQPLVMAIQSQITQKYPNATPQEINGMVDQYFTEVVGKSFAKEAPADQSGKPNMGAGFDFSSFLS